MKMISIVIIVKNDREIEDTLNSLKKINKPEETEIIVVDASKKEFLQDIKNKFPKVRWFYYRNKNKKFTIPEQRNLGIKKSKGEIIVFVDSGCTVNELWLKKLVNPILNQSEMIVAGIIKSKDKSIHDHCWKNRKSKYLQECGTANFALKKDIFKKLGYFDQNLRMGEDVDLTWRIVDAGYKIRYVPSAIMYHNWGEIKSEIKRAINYGKSRLDLHLKHKNRRWKLKSSGLDLFTFYSIGFFFYMILLIPISIFYPYFLLLIIIPFLKNIKYKPIRKMIFDFFWGYGVIKRLFERKYKK